MRERKPSGPSASGRPKLVSISDIATPQQLKFCEALQPYFAAEFWFYESPGRKRGAFWEVALGPHAKIIDKVFFARPGLLESRYYAPYLSRWLDDFDPDIVMLGGFSRPSNYFAYRWARRHNKKTIVFTERSRDGKGVLRGLSPVWRLLRWLYRDLDMIMVSAADVVPQFRDDFGFGDRVVAGRYSADLDAYFQHPERSEKPAYTYLFANRLTDIYNPIGALDIFAEVLRRHPGSRLLMNAAGELGDDCRARIAELGIDESVEFLTDIPSWDHLHRIYSRSDILLLPARFSNGNFTILEAMASGMGVVISEDVLGVGQLIEDGRNGFRCAPTIPAFVDRIEQYIRDPALFSTHAAINRPIVQPLSTEGTARFFGETVTRHLEL